MSVRRGMDSAFGTVGRARRPRSCCCSRLIIACVKRSNSGSRSCGPGLASGWPWKLKPGCRCARCPAASRRTATCAWRARSAGSVARIDREAVVLAGDHHAAGGEVLHRMIGAVMAELHLHGLRTARQPQQLMAEADAEHRNVGFAGTRGSPRWRSCRAPDRRDRWTGRCHPDSSPALRLPASVPAPRSCGSRLGQQPQDVALDAEVVGDHVQALLRTQRRAGCRSPQIVPSFH